MPCLTSLRAGYFGVAFFPLSHRFLVLSRGAKTTSSCLGRTHFWSIFLPFFRKEISRTFVWCVEEQQNIDLYKTIVHVLCATEVPKY